MFYYRIRLYGYVQLTAPGVRTNILKEKRKKLTHSAWHKTCLSSISSTYVHMYIYIYVYMLSCPKQAAALQAARIRADNSCKLWRPCLLQSSSSEDAGSLSHLHTDRPLGRPRGPLLQQHVGLLVAQRRLPGRCTPPCCLVLVQLLRAAVYLKSLI